MLEKQIEDYWNVDGEEELSDAWTGFTRFTLLNEKPPDGYTWSDERLTRKQPTSRPDNVWPDMWKHVSDAAKKKAKQRWAIEKPKLRQRRRIFFMEPNDEAFKLTMKAARRMARYWETQDKIRLCCWCRRKHETKTRRSWTQTSSRSHHCKRDEFYNSFVSSAQVHSDASSIKKIPNANAAVEKKWWSKNGRCSQIVENFKVRTSRYLDTSTEAQLAEIMVQHGRSSRSSRKESVRSSSHRTIMVKGILRKFYWNTVGEKFPIGTDCL